MKTHYVKLSQLILETLIKNRTQNTIGVAYIELSPKNHKTASPSHVDPVSASSFPCDGHLQIPTQNLRHVSAMRAQSRKLRCLIMPTYQVCVYTTLLLLIKPMTRQHEYPPRPIWKELSAKREGQWPMTPSIVQLLLRRLISAQRYTYILTRRL